MMLVVSQFLVKRLRSALWMMVAYRGLLVLILHDLGQKIGLINSIFLIFFALSLGSSTASNLRVTERASE